MCGKSPNSISRIWWASCRSSTITKNICSPIQCFFCKLVQIPILVGYNQQMGTFCIDYSQICGQSPNSISRILWALFRSSITIETFCSPLQCFCCKWVQMPNFGRLKSANEHILYRLFPNLMQISQIHFAYMVGIMSELHYHQKYLLCNAVLLM